MTPLPLILALALMSVTICNQLRAAEPDIQPDTVSGKPAIMRVSQADIYPAMVTVIDGDTIRVNPYPIRDESGPSVPFKGQRWRLIGFDTPEIEHARCADELAKGLRAKRRLQELFSSNSAVNLIPSGRTDRYGRQLGKLTINGEDVGAMMIGEGLARQYDGGQREGWCDG